MVPNNTQNLVLFTSFDECTLTNPTPHLTEVPLNLKITEILSPFNDKNISEL